MVPKNILSDFQIFRVILQKIPPISRNSKLALKDILHTQRLELHWGFFHINIMYKIINHNMCI